MEEKENINWKKIGYGIMGALGIGVLLVCCLKYIINVAEKEEAKQIEEMKQEKADLLQVSQSRVKKYCFSLENSMAIDPLTDLKVEYRKIPLREYKYGEFARDELGDEEEEKDPYDSADYHYYYEVTYVCDSIDQVYNQMTQDGNYSGFIDLMNQIRMARIKVEDAYEIWDTYETQTHDKKIKIDIKGEYSSDQVTIKKTDGQKYQVAWSGDDCWIYINDEIVYTKVEPKTNPPSSNYYSGGSSSYHSSDPYDVHDYDNPDDFADEWADEFGDGDYDDGYDDAYDYWEDKRN